MNLEEAARGGMKVPEHLILEKLLFHFIYIYHILLQVTVVRQPKGPDGTRGFRPRGSPRERTPAVMDLMEQLTAQ